jgi:hypothetical protein
MENHNYGSIDDLKPPAYPQHLHGYQNNIGNVPSKFALFLSL